MAEGMEHLGVDDLEAAGGLLSLRYIPVRVAVNLLWEGNPKQHDIGGLCESISRHGFKAPSHFDTNLRNTSGESGAIDDGNGRVEALYRMESSGGYDVPRGIAKIKGAGHWAMPVLFGVDAVSEAAAKAYALDANNLTMAGGDFAAWEVARMWDEDAYAAILKELAESDEVPISVDDDDLVLLLDKMIVLGADPIYTKGSNNGIIDGWRGEVALKSLRANSFGLRAMTAQEFERLKESISEVGILIPLIVRPIGGDKFEVVDGNQRYRALIELGLTHIPVEVRYLSEAQAKAVCVSVNRQAGLFIADNLGTALSSAAEELGREKLGRVIGMTPKRMDSYKGTSSYGYEKDEATGVPIRQYKEYGPDDYDAIDGVVTLIIPLSSENFERVSGVLSGIDEDWQEAILSLVGLWLSSTLENET